MADACVFLMERFEAKDLGEVINIGVGYDMTIHELAEVVAKVVGFEGELVFDASKLDGAPRKFVDSARLTALGWQPKTEFEKGLRAAYADFLTTLEAGAARL